MSNKRNIAILAAVAAALNWSVALAREEAPPPTTGRSVEDIINEARERVEGKRERERKERQRAEQPRSFYFSLGGEFLTDASLHEVDRAMAVLRENAASLQFLEARRSYIPEQSGDVSLALGFELTHWLDIELAAHAIDAFWQGGSTGAVHDPNVSAAVQSTDAQQFFRLDASTYSLSLLPRWDINDYVGIFARVGVGYAQTMLMTDLMSSGFVSSGLSCTTEPNGEQKCTSVYDYERHQWGASHQTRSGVFPVAGIGVQLLPAFRLEYLLRAKVPIGEATTDVRALYFSFRAKSAWW